MNKGNNMKIVQINAVYGVKSTGKIVFDIHNKLKKNGEKSYVFWGIESLKKDDKSVIKVGNKIDHKIHALLRRLDGKQAWHSKYVTQKLCKKLEMIQPDVVHLHNLHSNYIHFPTLMSYLGKKKISVLVTLHDCWFLTGYCMHYFATNCNKWKKNCSDCPAVKKYIKKNVLDMFQIKKELFSNVSYLAVNGVSKWTSLAARESAILGGADLIETIYNWVDTDFFNPQINNEHILKKYNIPLNKKIILGVSQGWSTAKGIEEFIELATELGNDVHIVLVGQNSVGIKGMSNLSCIGYINRIEDIRNLYSAADLFVNPSKMETFGLVNIEALACGTPVLAYNNTGISEIIDEDCGVLIKTGDVKAMISEAKKMLEQGKQYYNTRCRQSIVKRFDKQTQIEKYIELYARIIQNNKDDRK